MKIASRLFEAFLKCPTKCLLRSRGETETENGFANSIQAENEIYQRVSPSSSRKRLLIDDWDGRVEAERRHLLVTRTLGVLAEAHQQQLLDFEAVLGRLSQTNFYLSDELIAHIRRSLNRQ